MAGCPVCDTTFLEHRHPLVRIREKKECRGNTRNATTNNGDICFKIATKCGHHTIRVEFFEPGRTIHAAPL